MISPTDEAGQGESCLGEQLSFGSDGGEGGRLLYFIIITIILFFLFPPLSSPPLPLFHTRIPPSFLRRSVKLSRLRCVERSLENRAVNENIAGSSE